MLVKKLRRCHNGDGAVVADGQQVRITGDNCCCISCDGAGEELVVVRVFGDYGNGLFWLYEERPGKYEFEDIDLQGGGKLEFGVGNDSLEFGVDVAGDAVDDMALFHEAQHRFRLAIPAEGRDEDVGVDDYFCDRAHRIASAAVSGPSFSRFTVRDALRVISSSGKGA